MSGTGVQDLLTVWGVRPVLVDVGAAGEPPKVWVPIAEKSLYVGFDADARELRQFDAGRFAAGWVMNKVLTWDNTAVSAQFNLTRYPACSSLLVPDHQALVDYEFRTLFEVVEQSSVPATSMVRVMQELGLSRVDWFKTDSQGCDLRLFDSIPQDVRDRVLAVDMEPGLIHAYQGEDRFPDVQEYMDRNGFWLSRMRPFGAVRIRQSSAHFLKDSGLVFTPATMERVCRTSQAWVELRYFRTLDWMLSHDSDRDDYRLLWVFAILDEQFGFSVDVAKEGVRRFGAEGFAELLDISLRMIRSRYRIVCRDERPPSLLHRLVQRVLWRLP